jgi:hypothetical protein
MKRNEKKRKEDEKETKKRKETIKEWE